MKLPVIACAVVAALMTLAAGATEPASRPVDPRVGSAKPDTAMPAAPSNPSDAQAWARFLEVERFARLPADRQARELTAFYRNTAWHHLNPFVLAILSTTPAEVLNRDRGGFPGGDPCARWAAQIQDAAATLTPEQVADKLGTRLWLDIGSYVRTRQVLQQHSGVLAGLAQQDLDAKDPAAVERACQFIGTLTLIQFTQRLLTLYLPDTPLSKPAHDALMQLKDPAILRPLLDSIEKNPKAVVRHAGLLQELLWARPADPLLLKLLDSPDGQVRYHAGVAVYECRDARLGGPAASFARDPDPRLRAMAGYLASNLPAEAFAAARPRLLPLLSDADPSVRLNAVRAFAVQKDPGAGPAILELLGRPQLGEGDKVTVMQALTALADEQFEYDMHNWGPAAPGNRRAIARFEDWLKARGAGGQL
jgi:HEAT repeat protein